MNTKKVLGIVLASFSILIFTINIMLAQISLHLDKLDKEYSPNLTSHIPVVQYIGVLLVFLLGIYLYVSKDKE
ncbi:hypothetical protein DFR58_106137 [Anaerobacterium chartisolvens]|uniref:Uncharacterized protein n=1 Tax=Anaerobacterium chartisolvens TaxID=1297424 RepID=A0A369BBI9_9FIRM|nr:hypothetical protein [Anaerobacterium chartisolvens]RCX17968.1 hypothetical protein DFR58_106137 [Anaerobacterium chartisolvens]